MRSQEVREKLNYDSTWAEMGCFFIVAHAHLGQYQFIKPPQNIILPRNIPGLEHLELKQSKHNFL